MVLAREKGCWGQVEVGKGWGEMEVEKEFAWGRRCTMQCADDVSLSCTLETCMILYTNVTPINLIKKRKKHIINPNPRTN